VRLVGAPEVLALHGAELAGGPTPVIAMGDELAMGSGAGDAGGRRDGRAEAGDTETEGPASVDVVWRATPGDAVEGVRTIAPGGGRLWRRAPLPAADALFELPAGGGEGALVVGGGEEQRAAAVEALAATATSARAVELPSVAELAAAVVVVVVGEPGAPLPALTAPALAAGRLAVAPHAEPDFGLAAGVDHLAYRDPEELARLTVAALRHPDAFAPIAALGRIAAEAHRASLVLARLATDLAPRG
jgi:hypothetical protein